MKPTSRLRAACALVAVLVLAAGCTSSTADGSTSSASASATASASVVDPSSASAASSAPSSPTPSVIDPPTPTAITLDPAAQEAADRAAVELAWSQFWSVSDNLSRIPEADRASAASEVAVDPTLSQVLEQARQFSNEGIEAYGSPVFHPYWQQSIEGEDIAVMGDCTDTSQTGSMISATGEKKTVGVPDNNTRISLIRHDDGRWRVEKIFYLVDVPCP